MFFDSLPQRLRNSSLMRSASSNRTMYGCILMQATLAGSDGLPTSRRLRSCLRPSFRAPAPAPPSRALRPTCPTTTCFAARKILPNLRTRTTTKSFTSTPSRPCSHRTASPLSLSSTRAARERLTSGLPRAIGVTSWVCADSHDFFCFTYDDCS